MRFRRTIAVVLLFSLSACWRYSELGVLPDPADLPEPTRVHIYDGNVVTLRNARLEADTVRGVEVLTNQERKIPLAAVDLLEGKQLNVLDSVIFGTAVLVVFYYMVRGIANRPISLPDLPPSAGVLAPIPQR